MFSPPEERYVTSALAPTASLPDTVVLSLIVKVMLWPDCAAEGLLWNCWPAGEDGMLEEVESVKVLPETDVILPDTDCRSCVCELLVLGVACDCEEPLLGVAWAAAGDGSATVAPASNAAEKIVKESF